jgi:hypothetical protein
VEHKKQILFAKGGAFHDYAIISNHHAAEVNSMTVPRAKQ